MPIEIKVEQRSLDWHKLRSRSIGSSEVSSILGTSPFRSALELWEEKTGRREGVKTNAAMQRGIDFEDEARAVLEAKTGMLFTPKVFRHDTKEYMQVSLDGITEDGTTICEIKCPTTEGLRQYCLQNKVPPYYVSQIDYQLLISGAARALFFCWYSDQESYVVNFERDENREIALGLAVTRFWEDHILTDIPPPDTRKKYSEIGNADWNSLAKEYIDTKAHIKDLEFKLADIEERLKEFMKKTGLKNVKGGGLQASEILRVGAVNYATIPQLIGVDLDKFRKASSSYIRFDIKGDGQ